MTALVKLQSNVKKSFSNGPKKPYEKKEWVLVADGEYIGQLVKVEEKTSKAGNVYLQARFEIETGEERKKQLVFTKFIINHANQNVVRVAMNKLQAMNRALGGSVDLEDTSELESLIGKKCVLKVVQKPGQDGFKDYNEIVRFLKI